MTTNIVCVNAGNYLGKGADYVNILFDSIRRNISEKTSFNFICFTDTLGGYERGITIKPLPVTGLKGWWNKLALFKQDLFMDGDRIIYFDLDTVITGGLDEIIKYQGNFAILRDFYRPYGLQSSIMAWEVNSKAQLPCRIHAIWENWLKAGKPELLGGDQEWIENSWANADIWQNLYPGCFVSYKINAYRTIPKGTKVVIFHGDPRPHEVKSGWVPKVWKTGGGTTLELEIICNTADEALIKNIRHALKLPYPRLQPVDAHEGHAVLVGGAPSLADNVEEIRERQKNGQIIFALNGAYQYLSIRDINPDCHVMIDARKENAEFVPIYPQIFEGTEDIHSPILYYSSQCHPDVFKKSDKRDVVIWHSLADGIQGIIGENTGDALIGGGYSVGMKAIALAHTLGYRKFHLYGYDSSYDEGDHHAYKQPLNDKEKILEVEMNGKKYRAAAWMCTQVEDFKEIARLLVEDGSIMTVHGTGLLPDCAKIINIPDLPDNEIVEIEGTWWPSKDRMARHYHDMTFADLKYLLLECGNKVAVQAGGNVGLWPKEMAKHFEAVHTFEPDALNFECLLSNCPEDNIIAYPYALGERSHTASLSRISYNCGAHFLKEGDEFAVVTIDSLLLNACDLIQLDIEGYEFNALKGAVKTIEKFHPVIMVEDKGLSNKYGSLMGDIGKWLEQFGYKIHSEPHRDIIFIAKPQEEIYNPHINNVNRSAHV